MANTSDRNPGLPSEVGPSQAGKPRKVVLTEADHEVWVDANVPRLVTVHVLHKGGEQSERHLKVTGKGRLTLV